MLYVTRRLIQLVEKESEWGRNFVAKWPSGDNLVGKWSLTNRVVTLGLNEIPGFFLGQKIK